MTKLTQNLVIIFVLFCSLFSSFNYAQSCKEIRINTSFFNQNSKKIVLDFLSNNYNKAIYYPEIAAVKAYKNNENILQQKPKQNAGSQFFEMFLLFNDKLQYLLAYLKHSL